MYLFFLIKPSIFWLNQKLEAWTKAQGFWANAYQNAKQPMVPQIQMGGGDKTAANGVTGAQQMMDMLAVKAAKDLGLDMSNVTGNTAAAGKK